MNSLSNKLYGSEFNMISRNEHEISAAENTVKGKLASCAVDMSVAAALHIIFPQKLEYLGTCIIQIFRRIMQKHIYLVGRRGLKRRFKTHDLAVHDFFIMLNALAFFVKPAAGAAD